MIPMYIHENLNLPDEIACQKECQSNDQCNYFSYGYQFNTCLLYKDHQSQCEFIVGSPAVNCTSPSN